MTKRTQYSAEYEARVAHSAIREDLTLAGLSKKHSEQGRIELAAVLAHTVERRTGHI